MINFDHANNLHTSMAPTLVLPLLRALHPFDSLLDVGCGAGYWMKAASDIGVSDVVGIDGVVLPDETFVASRSCFMQINLDTPVDMQRRFDICLCLEVAEHLKDGSARVLIKSLVSHSDIVLFSAGCPHQPGQNHVNCQWPAYWQEIFNSFGFVCEDSLRFGIWELEFDEWWYKQNVFVARWAPDIAGQEPRLLSVVHPNHLDDLTAHNSCLEDSLDYLECLLQGRAGLRKTLKAITQMLANSLIDFSRRRFQWRPHSL